MPSRSRPCVNCSTGKASPLTPTPIGIKPRGCTPLHPALGAATATLHRASSLVENLNRRLRTYFFLRRHIGPAYLELLRFFLNHRPFLRSHPPERRGKTPTQLLTAQDHPHWLELLGFQRFRRAVI